MQRIAFHTRTNGSCPYDEYVSGVHRWGKKNEAAKIRVTVEQLDKWGSVELVKRQLAEKMNDVWQLRVKQHRIFYFWHEDAQQYIMLNGFRKATKKTPPVELHRAEALRAENLEAGGGK